MVEVFKCVFLEDVGYVFVDFEKINYIDLIGIGEFVGYLVWF